MLTFMGFHDKLDGYGYGTIKIGRALQQLDPSVTLLDMTHAQAEHTDATVTWTVPGTAVALCTPDWLPKIRAGCLIAYTMFETDKLPAGWVDKLNRYAQQVLVPCAWCARVFADNGVTVPIGVVKWGIDPADYYPLERPIGRKPYTFLWSGTADQRKGWDIAYRAFAQAFGDVPDVRLRLHFRNPLPVALRFADRNVETCVGKFDRPALREMLQAADCFVFPSRGEGWGSPPREAAATGLPVIATNYGGLHEGLARWGLPVDITGFSEARYGFWDDIGQWAEPSIEQTVRWMVWCYEHQAEARDLGASAAQWLATAGTWQNSAESLLQLGL
jgi:glycosyltransferase involved in cell wall biosynthesis